MKWATEKPSLLHQLCCRRCGDTKTGMHSYHRSIDFQAFAQMGLQWHSRFFLPSNAIYLDVVAQPWLQSFVGDDHIASFLPTCWFLKPEIDLQQAADSKICVHPLLDSCWFVSDRWFVWCFFIGNAARARPSAGLCGFVNSTHVWQMDWVDLNEK